MKFLVVICVLAACKAPPQPTNRPLVSAPPPVTVAFESPGPLIRGHATLACYDCHAGQAKVAPNARCLGCHEHEPLAQRIAAGRGFHASSAVLGKACASCHSDHRGATYDAMGWAALGGRDKFDHDYTGYALDGAHAAVTCDRCHTARTQLGRPRYISTDTLCGACHKSQPHGFQRREMFMCGRCHTTAAWAPIAAKLEFDHDDRKDAKLPLGIHAGVACATCHPNALFDLPNPDAAACQTCHQARTPHRGTIYMKIDACGACHSPMLAWKQLARFDHVERAGYDLGHAHDRSACGDCHTKALGPRPPAKACEACHAKAAVHKARFAAFGAPVPACGTCHPPSGVWTRPTAFAHDKHTPWRLVGKHAEIACRACHRGTTPTEFERFGSGNECMNCHAHGKVHDGKYTNADCQTCHPN